MLILFQGLAGGHNPADGIALPPGVEVATDGRRIGEADAVVFQHKNPAEYASYLAWRPRPFRPAFERLLAGQAVHPLLQLIARLQALGDAR